jgi:dCMP deaminase
MRSEDPYRKVGGVAFDKSRRVIATSYNGVYAGYSPTEEFWKDRDWRQRFMLHAEANLCSLFRRGEVETVALTTLPCTSCMQLLCAHDVKVIIYGENYPDSHSREIAKLYGIELIHMPLPTISVSFANAEDDRLLGIVKSIKQRCVLPSMLKPWPATREAMEESIRVDAVFRATQEENL